MKKSLFLLVAALLLVGMGHQAYALNAPADTAENQQEQWFVSVTNNSGGSLSHGQTVVWNVDSDSGEVLGESVKTQASANLEIVAGVVPGAPYLNTRGPILDGERFKMQIWGYHGSVVSGASAAEGQALGTAAALGVADDGDGLGVALVADAGGTVQAFINVNGGAL